MPRRQIDKGMTIVTRPPPLLGKQPATPSERASVWVLQIGAWTCVLAALPYTLFDLDRHSVPKELVLHATAFVSMGLLLASARKIRITFVDCLLGGYLLLCLCSAIFASNHWLAFRSLALSVSGAGIFWSARSARTAGLAPSLLIALGVGVVLGASTALGQAYGLFGQLASLSRAPGGTFGNRNFMAHLLAIGLPILGWTLVRGGSRLQRSLWCVGVAIVSAALVLSRTRAAWLAVGLGAGVGVSLTAVAAHLGRIRLSARGLLAVGLAAALGVALAVALPNKLDWRSPTPYVDSAKNLVDYRSGSGRGRMIQYGNSLQMATDHPLLGVGPGNWPVAYPRYATRRDPSYNASLVMPTNPWPSSDWMAVAAEQGLPGIALLLTVFGSIGLGAGRRAWHSADGEGFVEGTALLLSTLALLVVGSFDAVIHLPVPTLFFWAIAGALFPTGRAVSVLNLEDRRRRSLALAAATLLGTAFAARSGAQWLAMRAATVHRRPAGLEMASRWDPGNYRIRMLAADAWADAGRCDRAWPHAVAASRLFPHLPAPRRLLQRCGEGSAGDP